MAYGVQGVRRVLQGALHLALDFPIPYKILFANTFLVAIALFLGFALTNRYAGSPLDHPSEWDFALGLGALLLLSCLILDYLVLRAALRPITLLTHLCDALQRGELHARARRPLLGDRNSDLLIQTANNLLDDVAAYRSRAEDLSRRVTQQLETERENIARELHDETAQNLAALLVVQEIAAQAPTPEAQRRALEEAKQLTRLTLEGVRRISVGLRPAVLDDAGLPDTLRWYVRDLMRHVLPEVDLDLEQDVRRLPQVAELALYRIAQEALSNVAHHAQASRVSLSLRNEGGEVILRITDNGVGFDPCAPSLRHPEHLGLFTIHERARLAGGVAEVLSQPGKGAAVIARVPCLPPSGEGPV